MFASLKNKIGKEIGNDVTAVVRHAGSVRGINSRHVSQTGSSSSVSGSQLSLDESQESAVSPTINIKRENSFELKLNDGTELSSKDIKRLESREDEWRKRLAKKELECQKKLDKKDEEWKIKMFEREKEWKKNVEKLEKDKQKLEDGRLKAESAKQLLETALRDAEEYKKKLHSFQEDAEQLEGFQTQEMAKIKHLLLAKEQEVEEKTHNLKAALTEIDNLKTELSRLRRYEQELNDIQDKMESLRHTTQREKSQLTGDLEHTKEEVRHLLTKVSVLEQRLALESNDQSTVDDRIADLMRERTLLERKLEETHLHLSDIKTSWSSTISNLETQVGRLSRQAGEEGLERRRVEEENDKLKLRVKQLEEDIEESSSKEIESLKEELEEAAKKLTTSASELTALKSSYEAEKENNSTLHMQLARLRESLEAERTNSATLRVNLEKEQSEKDSALLRNAQMSQNFEIAKQEQRTQEIENIELQTRLESLEESLKAANSLKDVAIKDSEEMKNRIIQLEALELDRKLSQDTEQSLKNNLANLEDQINDKNKTIKVLQQRLADMKKTLQRELRVPSSSFDNDDSAAILTPSSSKTVTAKHPNSQEEDVNFKYLKHVLIKFLTSREYEALHLTRAVATLLHFSPEEERLLQETLEWKMSWFGTRPNLGFGQTAKAIPPS
ncbi:golgin subfamily A member 1-like isoform X1 [Cotesia glomerata]|uniref:golgin subfamily A member 1-like isoform X1 n=1 Tax=Cotesia glomerata TaxID=32391 RepID=UPI001D0043FC|nr:golgin subfamily A member 1-like isoform X1 [Cotesia glomerata]